MASAKGELANATSGAAVRTMPRPAALARIILVSLLATVFMGITSANVADEIPAAVHVIPARDVTTGWGHTCALLATGSTHCWGSNWNGESDPYHGVPAIGISAQLFHTCLLLMNGNVHCSGSNWGGQSNPYTGEDATDVATGHSHTCVLLVNANVHCWGENNWGQSNPYTGGDAISITAGYGHNCALLTGGNVHCWGSNHYGQADAYTGGDATSIIAGYDHTCALLTNGNVHCWGYNSWGQSEPYMGGDATSIAAGNAKTCVVRSGNVHCWGINTHTTALANPYTGGEAVGASAGGSHDCAHLATGEILCWGNMAWGQHEDYRLVYPLPNEGVAVPLVRAKVTDHAWIHFGAPGAAAEIVAPTGASMKVRYLPQAGDDCPGLLPKAPYELLEDCLNEPVVAKVDFTGKVLTARAAFDASKPAPTSDFEITCTPAPLAPTREGCLAGAGVDGSWRLTPAKQAPRLTLQPKAPAGMVVTIAGKTFHDVAPDSGDISTTGSGQNSRDALMATRLWNWRQQAPDTTYDACSGGLIAPCPTEGPPQENIGYVQVFPSW